MESARAIQALIDKARAPAAGLVATVLSLMTLLLGDTGVVSEIKDILNTIWHVQPARDSGFRSTLKACLMSLVFVSGIGWLLLVSLLALLFVISKFLIGLYLGLIAVGWNTPAIPTVARGWPVGRNRQRARRR